MSGDVCPFEEEFALECSYGLGGVHGPPGDIDGSAESGFTTVAYHSPVCCAAGNIRRGAREIEFQRIGGTCGIDGFTSPAERHVA